MKTYDQDMSYVCLLFCSNYHPTTIYFPVTSIVICKLERKAKVFRDLLQLLPTVCNSCRALIVVAYCLQGLKASCNLCLPSKTPIDLLQLLLMVYNINMPSTTLKSSGSYLLTIALASYPNIKYKQYFHCRKKEPD